MAALTRLGLGPEVCAELGRRVHSEAQEQTRRAFGYKWGQRASFEGEQFQGVVRAWLIERYLGGDPALLDRWLAGGRKLILDAGCGAALSALQLFGEERLRQHDYLGVDISSAIDVARARFAERGVPGDFLQASLMDLPLAPGSVDLILAEGVLHHTDDTGAALRRLADHLAPGGRFLFYVYRRKAPLREYSDDLIRAYLRPLDDAQAWEALKPLTRLGKALGDLGVELEVPEDVPCLGIPAGKSDLQRFFYWNVCKAFYRPEFTLEEMNHVNFDWFRPLNCHRHTEDEVRELCRQARLAIERLDVQEAGITVVGRREGP